jgi:hypothetical protein
MHHALTFCNRLLLRVVFHYYLGVMLTHGWLSIWRGRMQTLLTHHIMANVETADRTVHQA